MNKVSTTSLLPTLFSSWIVLSFIFPSKSVAETDCVKASGLVRQGAQKGDGSAEEEGMYREAIASCPHMAEAYHNLGINLSKQKRAQDALEALQKSVSLRDEPRFRIAYAHLLFEQGKVKEARTHYEQVISRSPDELQAIQGISVVAEKEGDLQKALEFAKKALALDPKDTTSLFNAGALSDRVGDNAASLRWYGKVVELKPDLADGWYYLGLAQKRSGQLSEAERSLLSALQFFSPTNGSDSEDRSPSNSVSEGKVHQALGILYEAKKEFDKAEGAFQRASDLEPKSLLPLINLAAIQVSKREHAHAAETAQKALTIDPTNARAHLLLGIAQLQMGNLESAEASFRESVARDPKNAAAHYNLGVLYQQTGKKSEAQRQLKIASDLDPKLHRK
jgi:tetratricopeptide (TPR) repeat protein